MRVRVVGVVSAMLATLLTGAAQADPGTAPVNTDPPVVTGEPVFRQPLRAEPGGWTSDTELDHAYQWLRDGRRIRGETGRRYRPQLRDLGSRLSIRVVAADESGATGTATSEPTARVRRADLELSHRPQVSGTLRYTRLVTASPGEWSSPRRPRVRYRWLRGGEPIRAPPVAATGCRPPTSDAG